MGDWEQGLYCETCQRQTLHRQPRPNHVLHFLITFFTCFLWAPIWIALSVMQDPYVCANCGTRK